ncbi:MAG TPA: paraquat-inducible protein A, partial [Planctomycetota bacterium]|nr:paraquat-inducible protein A [Planctomycetota bacterium]
MGAPAAAFSALAPSRNGHRGARASAFQLHGFRFDVVVPLLLATAALPLGLLLPVIHFSWALKADTTFTVITGVADLLQGGHVFVGLIILLFSVIFPVTKILCLYGLWFVPLSPAARESPLRWLEFLGKWSMLDVFVVAILIGALDLGILSEATPRVGAYIFTVAVLFSMAATLGQSRVLRRAAPAPHVPKRPSIVVPLLAVVALGLLCAGLSLPMMKIDKWLFWGTEYAVLGGTAELVRQGHGLLAVIVGAFVVAAPVLQSVGAVAIWALGRARSRRKRI